MSLRGMRHVSQEEERQLNRFEEERVSLTGPDSGGILSVSGWGLEGQKGQQKYIP